MTLRLPQFGPRLRFFILWHVITAVSLFIAVCLPILAYFLLPPWLTTASEFGTAYLVLGCAILLKTTQLLCAFYASEYVSGTRFIKRVRRFLLILAALLLVVLIFLAGTVLREQNIADAPTVLLARVFLLSPVIVFCVALACYVYLVYVIIRKPYTHLPSAPHERKKAWWLAGVAPMIMLVATSAYYTLDVLQVGANAEARREFLIGLTYERGLEKGLALIEQSPRLQALCKAPHLTPTRGYSQHFLGTMEGTQATLVFTAEDGSCDGVTVALCDEFIDSVADVDKSLIIIDKEKKWSFFEGLPSYPQEKTDRSQLITGSGLEALQSALAEHNHCILDKR